MGIKGLKLKCPKEKGILVGKKASLEWLIQRERPCSTESCSEAGHVLTKQANQGLAGKSKHVDKNKWQQAKSGLKNACWGINSSKWFHRRQNLRPADSLWIIPDAITGLWVVKTDLGSRQVWAAANGTHTMKEPRADTAPTAGRAKPLEAATDQIHNSAFSKSGLFCLFTS